MTVTHRKRKERDLIGGGLKYHCDGCSRDITSTVRIRCTHCADFDLCVLCFSQGHQSQSHENTHPYRVLDRFSLPLMDVEWGGDEEYLLIEAVGMYGMGNWADIADHVGTKSLAECREHYIKYYISSPTYPLPQLDVRLDEEEVRQARARRLAAPVKSQSVLPPYKTKVMPSQPANHDLQGYMPNRLEFDMEHENEAESLVKDLQFSTDDLGVDVDVKCAVMEIYNSKLDRRGERKKFIFDRCLVDFKKVQVQDRKRSRDEKEVLGKTKVFSRLMTVGDYQSFVDGLVVEQAVRGRVALLQEYRRNGVKSFREGEQYQLEKKARIQLLSKTPFATTTTTAAAATSNSTTTSGAISSGNGLLDTSVTPKPTTTTTTTGNRTNTPTPLDLTGCEGVDNLTTAEQALCSTLRLFPRAYMAIKNVLIREAEKRGGLKRRDARMLVRIDVNKLGKIYDFFVAKSWIKVPISK